MLRLAARRAAALRPRALCTGVPKTPKTAAQEPPPTLPKQQKIVPTSTTMFRFTNPELYMDPQKASTWKLIGGLWVVFGSYAGYLYCTDDPIERARKREEKRKLKGGRF